MRRKTLLAIILTTTLTAGCFFLLTTSQNLEQRIISQETQRTLKGHIERKIIYDPRINRTEQTTKEYTYEKEEESKVIEYQDGSIEIIETPNLSIKITTKYDPEGNQTEKQRLEYIPHDNSTNYSYITTYFDLNGNQVEHRVEVFSKNDIFIRGFTEFYNAQGTKTREESIFIEGNQPIISESKTKEE